MKVITDIEKFLTGIKDGARIYDVIREAEKNPVIGKRVINQDCYVNIVACVLNENEFDCVFECHRRYADVQYLISGTEKLYYGKRPDMTVVREYSEKNDIEFLKGNEYADVSYHAGQAVLLDAGEPHAPSYISHAPGLIIKAVIKLK